MHIMKMESQQSDREVLAGLVERVTYQNADNGFCVIRVKARGHRDLITVVGHAAVISAGEWITAAGEWTNDRTHGQQFKARFLKTSAPTSAEGIEKYLGSGMIRGIGPVYAKKLLRAFGDKVFDVIEAEPGRLRDVDGIGPVRANRIVVGWAEQKVVREIMVFLHSHGVGSARAVRIYKTYGADAVQVMSENPYRLGPRHPRHRFQDGRRHRDEAWRRENRHDPGAGRHLLCADRGDGRGALRPAHGRIDAAGRKAP
jgi:exodeoxyribonuclease V alpha subunit